MPDCAEDQHPDEFAAKFKRYLPISDLSGVNLLGFKFMICAPELEPSTRNGDFLVQIVDDDDLSEVHGQVVCSARDVCEGTIALSSVAWDSQVLLRRVEEDGTAITIPWIQALTVDPSGVEYWYDWG